MVSHCEKDEEIATQPNNYMAFMYEKPAATTSKTKRKIQSVCKHRSKINLFICTTYNTFVRWSFNFFIHFSRFFLSVFQVSLDITFVLWFSSFRFIFFHSLALMLVSSYMVFVKAIVHVWVCVCVSDCDFFVEFCVLPSFSFESIFRHSWRCLCFFFTILSTWQKKSIPQKQNKTKLNKKKPKFCTFYIICFLFVAYLFFMPLFFFFMLMKRCARCRNTTPKKRRI